MRYERGMPLSDIAQKNIWVASFYLGVSNLVELDRSMNNIGARKGQKGWHNPGPHGVMWPPPSLTAMQGEEDYIDLRA